MAAAKGNQYWQFREKHGRHFSYTPDQLWDEAVKYFEYMEESVWSKQEAIKSGELAGTTMNVNIKTPLSIQSFCLFADISDETFANYISNKEPYKDFFGISTYIKGIIESNQFEGATVGIYNPNIIARKLGLTDKSEVRVSQEQPLFGDDED